MAATTTLELTVLSCQTLRPSTSSRNSPYAAVSIVSDHPHKPKYCTKPQPQIGHKTPVDRVRNRNPEWNHSLTFDLGPYLNNPNRLANEKSKVLGKLFVRFEVRHEGTVLGNRALGEVRVPMSELLKESCGARRFVRYQVSNRGGRLNFSYEVKGNSTDTATRPPPAGDDNKKLLEVAVDDPKKQDSPEAAVEDVPSPRPMLLSRQSAPNDTVFYIENNIGRDTCTYYKASYYYAPAPQPGRGPGQYPSRIEVIGGCGYTTGRVTTNPLVSEI